MKKLRIGTRGSELALWQANFVRDCLLAAHRDVEVELIVISTKGDRVLDESLAKIPGKGLFTKEIEEALLDGRVDLAVHSLKDLPTEMVAGLTLAGIMRREDPAEALLSRDGLRLEELPQGAAVMTGSLRRQAQLLHVRNDLRILPIRGNVPTRIRKFKESGADGLILARAGLVRLGMDGQITQRLEPDEFLPACGQGAMAVEIRAGDDAVAHLCAALEDAPTRACVTAEREFLAALGGGCQAPIGAYARFEEPRSSGRSGEAGTDTAANNAASQSPVRPSITLTGFVGSLDGRRLVKKAAAAPCASVDDAAALGRRLARLVMDEGVDDILRPLAGQDQSSREDA